MPVSAERGINAISPMQGPVMSWHSALGNTAARLNCWYILEGTAWRPSRASARGRIGRDTPGRTFEAAIGCAGTSSRQRPGSSARAPTIPCADNPAPVKAGASNNIASATRHQAVLRADLPCRASCGISSMPPAHQLWACLQYARWQCTWRHFEFRTSCSSH